jgi:hypothetical protein
MKKIVMNFPSLRLCFFASLLLLSSCASTPGKPERPEGANIEFFRPKAVGKMIAATDIMVRSGRVPLLAIRDGQTRFGALEPGTYHLTAVSPDPYRFSDFGSQNWVSPRLDLTIETGKFYSLEIVAAAGQGWEIRRSSDEE